MSRCLAVLDHHPHSLILSLTHSLSPANKLFLCLLASCLGGGTSYVLVCLYMFGVFLWFPLSVGLLYWTLSLEIARCCAVLCCAVLCGAVHTTVLTPHDHLHHHHHHHHHHCVSNWESILNISEHVSRYELVVLAGWLAGWLAASSIERQWQRGSGGRGLI